MDKPKLHARQKKLLYILGAAHDITTGKELSARLGVSERTIRNDIVYMNEVLAQHGIVIDALHRKGYRIRIEDRSMFHRMLSGTDGIETKEDRIRHLIQLLIEAQDWMDLGTLEDLLYVSRTTLESDVREIAGLMSQKRPYMKLERRGNSLRFEQDERKKRSVLVRLFSEKWDYDSREGVILKDALIDADNLNQIRVTIKQVFHAYDLEFDDYGMVYLMLTIAVSYIRIMAHRDLPEDGSMEPEKKDSAVYRAVEEIFSRLCSAWNIEGKQPEYCWIAEIAEGLYSLNYHNLSVVGAKKAEEDRQVCERILEHIHHHYDLDFGDDSKLRLELLVFVRAIQNTIIPVQTQTSHYEEVFLKKYPIAGDMADEICRQLEGWLKIPLGKEERSFLLPMLIVALKKLDRRRGQKLIRAAVVSHYSMGMTDYLMEQVRYCYGEKMDILGPYSIYDREKIDGKEPSLILTTVKMDIFRQFDVPVIVLTSLMDEPDRQKINQCLERLLAEQEIACLPKTREAYFHSELDVRFHDRAELPAVLQFGMENLKKHGFLRSDQMLQEQECYGTMLNHGVLFWYQFMDGGQEGVMSMIHCHHRVSFEGTRCVNAVILLFLSRQESPCLRGYYQLAKEIADNYKGE